MPPSPYRYRWDERAARYRNARGRFVSGAAVRREIDRVIRASERRIDTLARQLQRRQLTVQDWELAMRREMKRIHLGNAAAAKGGWAQMAPADYGRVGQIMRAQYGFLNKFAQQIAKGLPLDGRFTRRVQLYAQSGRTTYEHTNRIVKIRAGMTEEKNVLAPSDHCEGCKEEAERGWVPIGTLSQVGTRDCLSRCRCQLIYR